MSVAIVFLTCSKRTDPQPQHDQPPIQDLRRAPSAHEGASRAADLPLSALLDVQAEKEAIVVAVVGGGTWQAASVVGKQAVARLARRGAAYQVFPAGAIDGEAAGSANGALAGNVREDCRDFYLALAAPATRQGFAVVSTARAGDRVTAVPLQSAKTGHRDAAAVAAVIERAAKVKVAPRIERAYRVDLDGNGKPETILEVTHAELLGDPPKHKRQHYSLVVVVPDDAGEPAFTGYLQAVAELSTFQVLSVDSVADIDRDGKRELLVRARHAEGWQTQVFHYDGKALKELFRSVGGEGECPEAGAGTGGE